MMKHTVLMEANGVVLCHLPDKGEFVVWRQDVEGPGYHSGFYTQDVGVAYANFAQRSEIDRICPNCGGPLDVNQFGARCKACGGRYSVTLTITSLTPLQKFQLPSTPMCHTPTVVRVIIERRNGETLGARNIRARSTLMSCFPGLTEQAADNILKEDFTVDGDSLIVYG